MRKKSFLKKRRGFEDLDAKRQAELSKAAYARLKAKKLVALQDEARAKGEPIPLSLPVGRPKVEKTPLTPLGEALEAQSIARRPKEIPNNPFGPGQGKGRLDLAKIIKLKYARKLTVAEIAQLMGCTHEAVTQQLKKYTQYLPNKNTLDKLSMNQADVLKGTLFNSVLAMNEPAKIKKASLNNVAYAAGQLFNMLRLTEGQSTSNLAMFTADYFSFIKQRGELADAPIDVQSS